MRRVSGVRPRDRLPGDHLASDAEALEEEALAVVAGLPRHVHETLVETQVQVAATRLAQAPTRRLGQQVREHEAADAREIARRVRTAAVAHRRHLGGEVAQERVVDADLAARDERPGLGEIHDDQVVVTEERDVARWS